MILARLVEACVSHCPLKTEEEECWMAISNLFLMPNKPYENSVARQIDESKVVIWTLLFYIIYI
jgi:hypothetical protein